MESTPQIDVRLTDHPVTWENDSPFPPNAGAECVFLGRTRHEVHPKFGKLTGLHYEAYREMAEPVMTRLAREAAKQFDCFVVRIHHATGPVQIGEASVLIQTICGHRDEAFRACRFLIDQVKQQAPIWKRELWERGSSWSQGSPIDVSDKTPVEIRT